MLRDHGDLSKQSLKQILDIISECLAIQHIDQFKACISNIKYLVPYEKSFCIYTNTSELTKSNLPSIELININYPEEVWDIYFQDQYNVSDPVTKELFHNKTVQNWDLAFNKNEMEYPDWAQDLNIRSGYTYGVFEDRFSTVSTFSFSQMEKGNHRRTEIILSQIGPHLAEAMKRALGQKKVRDVRLGSTLTTRELEVLNWITQGKSSWEISMILNISERTVNFHINHIIEKLNASNRTHAVAIALTHAITQL